MKYRTYGKEVNILFEGQTITLTFRFSKKKVVFDLKRRGGSE